MCMQATSPALVRAVSPYFLSETRQVETVFVCFRERLINENFSSKVQKIFHYGRISVQCLTTIVNLSAGT